MRYDEFENQVKEKCGVATTKLDIIYNESDSRCWTALVGKDTDNVLITFHVNKGELRNSVYDVLTGDKQLLKIPQTEILDTINELVSLHD